MLTLPVGLLTASTVALLRSRTTSVASSPGRRRSRASARSAGVEAPPEAAVEAAQGGVDDHLAVGGRPRVDDDLVGARSPPAIGPRVRVGRAKMWSRGAERQVVVACCRAASRSPRRPSSGGSRRPASCCRRCRSVEFAVAGAGDDDRLVRVVVPAEDGDRADVDPEGRAEVGQRDVGRARSGRSSGSWSSSRRRRWPRRRRPCCPTGRTGRRRSRRPGRRSRCRGWVAGRRSTPGPTAVQVVLDSGLVGSVVKIRKLTVAWSATGSPRPVIGTPFWKVSDQLLSDRRIGCWRPRRP